MPKLGMQFNVVNHGTVNLSGMLVENSAWFKNGVLSASLRSGQFFVFLRGFRTNTGG
jgi:hypothetical protein